MNGGVDVRDGWLIGGDGGFVGAHGKRQDDSKNEGADGADDEGEGFELFHGWKLKRVGESVQIRVLNSGPGIQGEDRERIFERFHRVQTSRDVKVDGVGLGLGLGLAREIARAHGGDLCLEEGPADVAAFKVLLPLGAREQGGATKSPE